MIWFLYVTSNKGFLEFSTTKTAKQNTEYVPVDKKSKSLQLY